MTNEVAITGLGFVTSIGHARAEVRQSLLELRHGIGRWEPLGENGHPVSVAGLLRGFDVSSPDGSARTVPPQFDVPASLLRIVPPHGAYALCALQQALSEAGLAPEDLHDGDTGLYCASAGSAMLMHHHLGKLESTQYRRGHPLCVLNSIAGSLNFHLAAHLGIRGGSCGFVSACASSSHALGFAHDEIKLGRQERMIVVGAEELTPESFLPFYAMAALSTSTDSGRASRPFDVARDGFVGTGGAVVMVLESAGAARRRGVRVQALMQGWGQASDGHHPAQPHPEGAGLSAAMTRALDSSQINITEVGYINAHATSTLAGDRAEAKAIHAVFGSHGATPPVSSTKALTGHGLSLAGVMEAAFCVLALDDGFIPGQAHLAAPDEDAAKLNLPRATLRSQLRVALNNSSGFGGANVCHVFTQANSTNALS